MKLIDKYWAQNNKDKKLPTKVSGKTARKQVTFIKYPEVLSISDIAEYLPSS